MSTDDTKKKRGGARPGSGRPRKPNPDDYVQVTCVLRKDTVDKLKTGAGGKQKFFGHFLQFHLDRFPIPTREEYLAMKEGKVLPRLTKPRPPLLSARQAPSQRLGEGFWQGSETF